MDGAPSLSLLVSVLCITLSLPAYCSTLKIGRSFPKMQVRMYDLKLFIFKLQNVRFNIKYVHLMILF